MLPTARPTSLLPPDAFGGNQISRAKVVGTGDGGGGGGMT